MPAIKPHSTPTSGGPWDGPAHERRLRLGEEPTYYRQAYAWVDPDADPRTKSAYRFLHHEVDEDGIVGAANIRACQAGIAVLNGARGGTNIPDADRAGVYRHLARHLEDAGIDAPPLRSAGRQAPEVRAYTCKAEIRQEGDGPRRLVGYAAVFDVETELLFGFKERIAYGAFAKSLRENDRIVALWNHDTSFPLGSTASGTLILSETSEGLYFDVTLPATTYARDLIELVTRGDVSGASIGFFPIRTNYVDGVRVIAEAELIEVSPVTLPAYPTTSVSLRSLLPPECADLDELLAYSVPLSSNDIERIRRALDRISSTPEPDAGHHLLHKMRLELHRRELQGLLLEEQTNDY